MSGSKAIVTEPAENYYDSTLDILQRKILIKVKLSNMKMSHNILLNFLYSYGFLSYFSDSLRKNLTYGLW